MSKTFTLRSLALVVLLAFGWQASFAQTFWTESFSDQAISTTNWVHGGTNGGAEVWTWTNDPAAGFQQGTVVPPFGAATAGTGYFLFNSDANGEFDHDVTLTGTGVPVNCTGKSNVHLKFYTQLIHYTATATAHVGISTDGVNFTDTQILVGLPTDNIYDGEVDVDLDGADNQPQVWVRFRWIGNYEYHFKVDDLELYEAAVPTADVTFRVDMSTQTVDPSGVFITGSFNGWTDEAMIDGGNGVWTIAKTLAQGETVQYKFKNGATAETGNAACGVDDGAGGYNRTYTPVSVVELPAVCFNQCTGCVVPCDQNPNAIICDNFDTYNTALKLGPQATWWSTWSGTEGTTEDGIVTTEQANTAPNSLKIVSTSTSGGPQDVVLNLGNKTTGNYELKWKMYMPAAKGGYYNIQNVVPIGTGSWNLDVFFDATGGTGHIQIGAGAVLAEFTYPNAQWFEVKHVIDLDNNLLTLWINGQFVKKMAYPNNLGGIDFYGIDNTNQYYVDDVEYIALPAVVYNADLCSAAYDLSNLLGQAPGVAQNSGLFDNTDATVSATDPAVDCWAEAAGTDILDNTMWYTFTGDGQRYHIETNDCNGTAANYIGTAQSDIGDTQMAIYTGDNCSDLTLAACNDDLYTTGTPDWRAGLDFETVAGTVYYMLIDGFNTGVAATGEYCISFTQAPSVDCADAVVGTFSLDNNGLLCWGGNVNQILVTDPASFVIPTIGPVYGMAWCLSADPIAPGTWPGDVAGIASNAFNPNVVLVNAPNDGSLSFWQPGLHYITPVVLGGGTTIDPTIGNFVFNVDPTNGCYFVGESVPITLIPELNDLLALPSVTNETIPPGNNGTITLAVEGGIAEAIGDPSLYIFEWNTGATTQNLTGLAGGTYTVTISDPSGCVADFTLSVSILTGIEDPASVELLTVAPNPASTDMLLSLQLESAMDVRIELVNTLGQKVQTIDAGNVKSLSQHLDVAALPQGAYFLRVTIGTETAVRNIVLQR